MCFAANKKKIEGFSLLRTQTGLMMMTMMTGTESPKRSYNQRWTMDAVACAK